MRIDQINQPALDRTVIFRGSGAQGTSAAIHEQNVARIKTQLTQTHCRQSISGDRNRCWLRTSWLPLLTKLPPEALAQKAAGMLSEPPHASTRHMPAILTAIGRQFREGPTTFLSHRRLPGNDRRAVLDEPVELGGRLNALPGYSSDWGRPADESVEDYLKDMQMAIARAAAIAERADSIHEEIRNQLDADSTATSDLAILLHRAFGVPTLVIEERNATQASDGQAPGQYVKVRALMPEGAEHAESASVIRTWASVNDEAFPLDSVVLPQLLEKYRDHHIIWLRNGHFEAYVPHTDLPPAAPPSATSS